VYFIDSFVFVRGFRGAESSLAQPTRGRALHKNSKGVLPDEKTESPG